VRHVRFEVANGLIQSLGRLYSFRWKELERKHRRIAPHDVGNVHRLGAYLRSCRDFRSTQSTHIFPDAIIVNRIDVPGSVHTNHSRQRSSVLNDHTSQRSSRAAQRSQSNFREQWRTPAPEIPNPLLVLERSLRQLRRLPGPGRDS
jgi:hypothetical protein